MKPLNAVILTAVIISVFLYMIGGGLVIVGTVALLFELITAQTAITIIMLLKAIFIGVVVLMIAELIVVILKAGNS